MVTSILLLALVTVAAVTDVRRHKIYNATTYSGIVLALLLGAGQSLVGQRSTWGSWLGGPPFADRLGGLLLCGGVMLVCYVFFHIGGGDVKLIAMIGAFMGPAQGIEVMLWTFVLGGACALIVLVWKLGTWNLLRRFMQYVAAVLRLRSARSLGGSLQGAAATSLFLAPSALAAVVLVHFDLLDKWNLI